MSSDNVQFVSRWYQDEVPCQNIRTRILNLNYTLVSPGELKKKKKKKTGFWGQHPGIEMNGSGVQSGHQYFLKLLR